MKKIALMVLCFGLLTFCIPLHAQDKPAKKAVTPTEEEEDGPIMFKFEPDLLVSIEERRAEMERTRAILDTMDISDRKRKRILRDLYRKKPSKLLSRVLVTDTNFEDPEH